jgi:hypothetical protein
VKRPCMTHLSVPVLMPENSVRMRTSSSPTSRQYTSFSTTRDGPSATIALAASTPGPFSSHRYATPATRVTCCTHRTLGQCRRAITRSHRAPRDRHTCALVRSSRRHSIFRVRSRTSSSFIRQDPGCAPDRQTTVAQGSRTVHSIVNDVWEPVVPPRCSTVQRVETVQPVETVQRVETVQPVEAMDQVRPEERQAWGL